MYIQYVLPKPVHPFPRRDRPAATPGSQSTIAVTLKPMKAGSDTVELASQSPDVTVLDLKTQYAQKTSNDVGKIKLLYNKRPASDLKTLKELLPDPTPKTAELSVMILGAPGITAAVAAPPQVASPAIQVPDPSTVPSKMDIDSTPAPLSEKAETAAVSVSTEKGSTSDVLQSDEFWKDLEDFLVQRLKDQSEGQRLTGLFRTASKS